mmetsp:Transcript_17419/g.40561  ORF Transcript_17419/g.40561 Transcript_17419/m.40561 type:complete len:225 (+) Transcript_17419:393-1067(+)
MLVPATLDIPDAVVAVLLSNPVPPDASEIAVESCPSGASDAMPLEWLSSNPPLLLSGVRPAALPSIFALLWTAARARCAMLFSCIALSVSMSSSSRPENWTMMSSTLSISSGTTRRTRASTSALYAFCCLTSGSGPPRVPVKVEPVDVRSSLVMDDAADACGPPNPPGAPWPGPEPDTVDDPDRESAMVLLASVPLDAVSGERSLDVSIDVPVTYERPPLVELE